MISIALTGFSNPVTTGVPAAVQLTKRSKPLRLHRPALNADELTGVEASLPLMFRRSHTSTSSWAILLIPTGSTDVQVIEWAARCLPPEHLAVLRSAIEAAE
jgi:hypothetical protein